VKMKVTTLRIKKSYSTTDLAIRWFKIISILNDFNWKPMEINLLAFMCIKGDISGSKKTAFCEQFKCKKGSLANTLSSFKKRGFIYKNEKKLVVHPQLYMDFEGDILTTLNLTHA